VSTTEITIYIVAAVACIFGCLRFNWTRAVSLDEPGSLAARKLGVRRSSATGTWSVRIALLAAAVWLTVSVVRGW